MRDLKISREKAADMMRMLLKIRKTELKVEELYSQDEMKTPIHLALGQEAVAVGVCAHLNREDYIFSNHRSHAHYLAKGGDLRAMIAEFYCRETGCSKGRGGSMHLIDTSVGHLGSSAIVGGSIPHAVGAALTAKMTKKDFIAVTFFGDAASEQGVFFESMNWAVLKKLPVLFVCENNHYSVFSHISSRQPNMEIAMRARAFDLPAASIDGMDVLKVHAQAREAVEHARAGQGPYFIECRVQRWRGHAGVGDPQRETYRRPEELKDTFWRDPVADFREYVLTRDMMTNEEIRQMETEIDNEIDEAFRYARESPLPRREDLEKYLFAEEEK